MDEFIYLGSEPTSDPSVKIVFEKDLYPKEGEEDLIIMRRTDRAAL